MKRSIEIFVCLVACLSAELCSASEPPRSVLLLAQSGISDPMPIALAAAIRAGLRGHVSEPVIVYQETLDLLAFSGSKYQEALQTFLLEKYRAKNITVVITLAPGPIDFMLQSRSRLWPEAPIFAAVDENTADRVASNPNVVARPYRLTLRDMVTTARAVVPGLEGIVLIGNRNNARAHFTQELPTYSSELKVSDLRGALFDEVKKHVAILPERTAILYTGFNNYDAGTDYMAYEALTPIIQVANRPIVVDTENLIGGGAVGGFVVDPALIGEAAANFVLRILRGQSPSQIATQPPTTNFFSRPIFDWRQLQRWGVSMSDLPPGSEIRFRLPTAWEQYRGQILMIVSALLAQMLVIAILFYERRRRRFAEAVSRQRMSELSHMNRSATAGELSASIAHEITQPLQAITSNGNAGLALLAKTMPDLREAREAFQDIVDEAHRANGILGTIRSMFKKSDQEKVALDINTVIQEVLAILHGDFLRRRILVQTRLQTDLPLVTANRVQLQQVILNLCVNAADAMASVTDRDRVLKVKAERQPTGVLITVEDSGSGVEPKNIDRLFEPFYTTKCDGMGMGLAICRSIVEDHGGRLFATPGRPYGLAMQISLPASVPRGALKTAVEDAELVSG